MGCVCPTPTERLDNGKWDWNILDECPYHQLAAKEPWNHRIPWNCPTYWDGCNCDGGPYYEEPK